MDKVYTMFAGSYPDRIGNADDPDDIDVITKGITIIDPRWHKTKDAAPMRNASGENIGLVVYAFKNDAPPADPESKYYEDALKLRNDLQKQIPSYDASFEPASDRPQSHGSCSTDAKTHFTHRLRATVTQCAGQQLGNWASAMVRCRAKILESRVEWSVARGLQHFCLYNLYLSLVRMLSRRQEVFMGKITPLARSARRCVRTMRGVAKIAGSIARMVLNAAALGGVIAAVSVAFLSAVEPGTTVSRTLVDLDRRGRGDDLVTARSASVYRMRQGSNSGSANDAASGEMVSIEIEGCPLRQTIRPR